MDLKLSAFTSLASLVDSDITGVVRDGDTTNYKVEMSTISAYLAPAEGLVYSTGSAFDTATMGDGVAFASGTLDNTGVLSVGTLTGAVGLGANLTTTGGTLNATGFGSMSSWVAGTNLSGGTITDGGTASLSPAITITDATGKLVIDRNTGGTLDTLGTVYMQVVGVDSGAVRDVIDTFGAVGQFVTRRADGTRASKTAIQNGDTLGTFGAVGYDGTNYSTGGIASATPQTGMSAVANQNWSSSARGVNLVFFGIANAGTTIANFGTMASTGLVLSGGTISTAGNTMVLGGNFSTAGALTFSGANAVTLTSTGATSLTLPTSGTLSTTTGTVTSVAQTFTGGLISVAGSPVTTAGTLALTVAGTSGGIPYFNSGTSWATSGALAANSVVIGGGAGAAPTGAVLPPGWAITSGTIVPSNTIVVGLSNSIADTITAGTYDLGPFINGGTILNSYAHVVSGTIAFGVAIGQPGTYTDVTGLTTLTSTSTTIDTVGTATAANVISAGAHAWLKVTTGAVGGDVFITVKVP